MIPFGPCQLMAPPSSFAYPFMKVMLSIVTLGAVTWKMRALSKPFIVFPFPFIVTVWVMLIPFMKAASISGIYA